MHFYILQTFTP